MKELTGAEFASRAKTALGGHGWQTRMSEAIGKDKSTIRRWATGDDPVPAYAVALLELLEATHAAFRPPRWIRLRAKP